MIISPNFLEDTTINLNYDEYSNLSDGHSTDNIWIKWAYGFVKLCQEQLNLEVSKGPGTSIGIIQTQYGGIPYQYDCDWNHNNFYPRYAKPLSIWDNTESWIDSEDALVNELGIDYNNDRFDFVIWFTRQENNVNRIGLRFKYPIINSRDNYCSFYFSTIPVCMPWMQPASNEELQTTIFTPTLDINNEIERAQPVSLEDFRTNGAINEAGFVNTGAYYSLLGAGYSFLGQPESSGNYSASKISRAIQKTGMLKDADNNVTWKDFTNGNDDIINNHSNSEVNYAEHPSPSVSISRSYQGDTIVLQLSNGFGNYNLLSIVYGDFEVDKDGYVSSYILVSTEENNTKLGRFLLTEGGAEFNPAKQINRPTSTSAYDYCGLTKVIFQDKKEKHSSSYPTSSLYQVFIFNETLDTEPTYQRIFIDSNGNNRVFKLINFGRKELNSSVPYQESSLIAIEKENSL